MLRKASAADNDTEWGNAASFLGSGYVAANESTASTSFIDLTTVGPDAVFIAPASEVVVLATDESMVSGASVQAIRSFEVVRTSDSAVILAADFPHGGQTIEQTFAIETLHWPLSGLTEGVEYRVRMKYRAASGTASFRERRLSVLG